MRAIPATYRRRHSRGKWLPEFDHPVIAPEEVAVVP